jgi:cobalamin biosynthesis protein CobT
MMHGTVAAGGQMAPGEARSSAVRAAPYTTLPVSSRASGRSMSALAEPTSSAAATPVPIPSEAPTLCRCTRQKVRGFVVAVEETRKDVARDSAEGKETNPWLDAPPKLRLKARSRCSWEPVGCKGPGDFELMEIFLDKRAVKQIRISAQDAIEEGDTETLREDVLEAFTEEQVEEIERRLDTGDFFEFLTDMLDEWGGDDVDELFELLETQLGDVGIDLKYEVKVADPAAEDDEDEDDEDFDEDDEDEDDEDDEDEEEDDEEV